MIKRLFGQVRSSAFLKQNAIFFFGSLAVSVINYAYYPVLARMLQLEEYGEVQVLISFFLQLTLFLTVLTQVTVNIVANYKDQQQKNQVIFELQKLALYISVIILLVGTAGASVMQQLLHFHSPWPFVILLSALVATVPLTFHSAYLRGTQHFAAVSIANIIASLAKIGASVLFVMLGFSTAGAIGGVLAAQLIAVVYAIAKTRKLGFIKDAESSYRKPPKFRLLLPELKFAAFVFVMSLGVTLLSSIDVFIVKHFFDAETAGGYAGISTVAKILFFLTASIAQVMLPAVKVDGIKRQNRVLLLKSFVLVGGIGGLALGIFMLLPHFVVGLLMGANYQPYAHLLPMLSLAMFLISIINLGVFYYIALRRYQTSVVVITGLSWAIWLLMNGHNSLEQIVANLTAGSASILGLFVLWRTAYGVVKRRNV